MRNLFIPIVLWSCLSCSAQHSDFEKKLSEFRYGLNPLLNNYESEKLLNFNFEKTDLIISKIDSFVNANDEKIQQYQLQLLEQYSDGSNILGEMDQYEPVDVSKFNQKLNVMDVNAMYPLSKLLWINPIKEVEMYRDMYLMQKWTNTEYAAFNSKLKITASLVKTEKLNTKQWVIIENFYDFIIKAKYDLEKRKVSKIELYERRTDRNHK